MDVLFKHVALVTALPGTISPKEPPMTVLEAVTALEEAVAKVQPSQMSPGALAIILILTDFLDSLKALLTDSLDSLKTLTEALIAVLEEVMDILDSLEFLTALTEALMAVL